MISDKKTANVVGAKTARACDSCMRKRARWYCTADDAFLCQACDASVHSANSLARRHERVRLKTASFKPSHDDFLPNSPPPPPLPAWHQGFRRKARTPRTKPNKIQDPIINTLPLVPEMGSDDTTPDENDEQLLYRVPIFDPFETELCASTQPEEGHGSADNVPTMPNTGCESKTMLHEYENDEFGNLHGLLPSDMDLADFAADVETLLGRGLDEDSFGMEGLGLLEAKEEDNTNRTDMCYASGRVKLEDEEEMKAAVACHMDHDLDMSRETLDLNFNCESPTTCEEEDEKMIMGGTSMSAAINGGCKVEEMTRKVTLKLDYKAIIDAWSSQGLPWTTGDQPQFNPEDCWSDSLGLCPTDMHQLYGSEMGGIEGHMEAMMGGGDGGREARVSRYREKRRTRLFSKKIRYQVRKLNAEKRPRMKGRFVKRTSFIGVGGPSFPF